MSYIGSAIEDLEPMGKRFSYSKYEILQLMPADDWLVIYAQESAIHPDKHVLETGPPAYMALVNETLHHREIVTDEPRETRMLYTEGPRQDILPIVFVDGMLEVAAESINFAGFCRSGDDPYENIAYLDYSLSKTLISDGEVI